MNLLPDLEKTCSEILTEVGVIMKLLEQGMETANLHERINLFYYIETSTKMKQLIRDLRKSVNPDPAMLEELKDAYLLLKVRWQKDYRFLATPKSLHEFL